MNKEGSHQSSHQRPHIFCVFTRATRDLPCVVSNKLFVVTHKPIERRFRKVWTHKGERCSKKKKGSRPTGHKKIYRTLLISHRI